jgi:EAL domain-containing protein (putative c-di-GMP-specific phosphodiesterase class I)
MGPATDLIEFNPALDNITRLLWRDETMPQQPIHASHNGIRLFSMFQPIYSYALHRQVGFEALVRGYDSHNNIVLPAGILRGSSLTELLAIDRICRCLHLANFMNIKDQDNTWLFLNVNPLIVSEYIPNRTPFMKEVLDLYNIPPHRVVIEILETAISNETKFLETIRYYRETGCMIAIDDFGAGHSNFNRIWDCHPDFVKLDRSIFIEAMTNKKLRKSMPQLVNLLHDYGCLVLAEGIETYDQAIMCMDAEFDLIQGFLFSEPGQTNELSDQSGEIWSVLKEIFRNDLSYRIDEREDSMRIYIEEFHHVVMSLRDEGSLEKKCKRMIDMDKVIRFYLIDSSGEQRSANINSKKYRQNYNPEYAPLQNAENAIWYHRQYFRKALGNPGKVQVTGPYFSTTDAKSCITLSIARKLDNKLFVLCCDIEA